MAKRRPSGDGMVRKREDGRWEGRIVIGHKDSGEPIFRYVSAKTQKDLLKKLHQNIEEYRDVNLCEDSKMSLREWLDRWLEEYVKQLNDHLWEGRYSPVWPDGKKHSRNVYGHTEAECEEKLAELILQMNAEIAALRSGASTEYPDGVSPKKKAIAAYLRENPGVTNKSKIARDLNMNRTTVQKYYDEVQAEF